LTPLAAQSSRESQILAMISAALKGFKNELSGYRVLLFGSRASGSIHTHSDFDIGVLGPQALPLKLFYAIADRFDSLPTLFSIDWVDLNRTTETFRKSALEHTMVLYE
jgi:predicted nucleotidyltransferase